MEETHLTIDEIALRTLIEDRLDEEGYKDANNIAHIVSEVLFSFLEYENVSIEREEY